jgi:group II intron reverse transcriptase/maturase
MEPLEGTMPESLGSVDISPRLQRIAKLAREMPQAALTTLAHHIDMDLMREAFRRTRKDGATGVDGQTAAQFAEDLEGNLRRLLEQAKSGTYRAPAVRRTHVPKGDGSKRRPIGIPTFADKVLQRAAAMVMEAVFEQDFVDWSYGFRPGRSAHQAVQALWEQMMSMHGGWVIEVDIRSFFDELDHGHLRQFVSQRVRDGVLLRLVGKWLKAGVMEHGQVHRPKAGTPQGGVISPLLANVYLHEVFDSWFDQEVKPRMRGRVAAIRYADDIVVVAQRERDAQRIMEVLPKRFGRYGLRLHPEKTRLVRFGRPRKGSKDPKGGGSGGGRSFDFLGFTHYWDLSRKGTWIVKRRTAKARFALAVRRVWLWCRNHRHDPVEEQHVKLCQKVRGHYGYYGITGNSAALSSFWEQVKRAWRRWLNKRSQRARMNWPRFNRLLKRYPLPLPRVVHSYLRLAAKP